jgi:hypothetical protein
MRCRPGIVTNAGEDQSARCVRLARLFRSGELPAVWLLDAVHEAVRDLVRASERDRRLSQEAPAASVIFIAPQPHLSGAKHLTKAKRAGSPNRRSSSRCHRLRGGSVPVVDRPTHLLPFPGWAPRLCLDQNKRPAAAFISIPLESTAAINPLHHPAQRGGIEPRKESPE